MSQMKLRGRGSLIKPMCSNSICPEEPREGGGKKTWGRYPKEYFFILKGFPLDGMCEDKSYNKIRLEF